MTPSRCIYVPCIATLTINPYCFFSVFSCSYYTTPLLVSAYIVANVEEGCKAWEANVFFSNACTSIFFPFAPLADFAPLAHLIQSKPNIELQIFVCTHTLQNRSEAKKHVGHSSNLLTTDLVLISIKGNLGVNLDSLL